MMHDKLNMATFQQGRSFFCVSVFALSHLVILLFVLGCDRSSHFPNTDQVLSGLVDTVYTGQARQVFLSDGSGGFYFDDAFRAPSRGTFGFNRMERRLLSSWEVLESNGRPLDGKGDICIVSPFTVERRFVTGMVESVSLPHELAGMLISLKSDASGGYIYRPYFDIRPLDATESPQYRAEWVNSTRSLLVSRRDTVGGWLAIVPGRGATYRELKKVRRTEYPFSQLIGRPGLTNEFSPGEFQCSGKDMQEFGIGWGQSPGDAVVAANSILGTEEVWRKSRGTWAMQILKRVTLRADRVDVQRAFNWALLTMHKLRYRAVTGQMTAFSGIPYTPYPSGWSAMLALPGFVASGTPPEETLQILDDILSRQSRDTASVHYGMLPTAIRQGTAEYRIPEIAGLAVRAYERIVSAEGSIDTARGDSFAVALAHNLLGTAQYRIKRGMVFNGRDGHFLWDNPLALARAGATIESQVLLQISRDYLDRYDRIGDLLPGLPRALIDGQNSLKGTSSAVPLIAVSERGTFNIPTNVAALLSIFRDPHSGRWAHRIEFSDSTGEPIPEFEYNLAEVMTQYWYKSRDKRYLSELIERIEVGGMAASDGLRSLARSEDEYAGAHVYQLEEAPSGTKYRGDVLLWTNGALADIYRTTDKWDKLWNLAESLCEKVMDEGVAGALPEAENGDPLGHREDAVGSAVDLAATAEFVRSMCDNILGTGQGHGAYLNLRPRIPADWGQVEYVISRQGGFVRIIREANDYWLLEQVGIKPNLQATLEVYPQSGRRGLASLRLYPEGKTEVRFTETERGSLKADVNRR